MLVVAKISEIKDFLIFRRLLQHLDVKERELGGTGDGSVCPKGREGGRRSL